MNYIVFLSATVFLIGINLSNTVSIGNERGAPVERTSNAGKLGNNTERVSSDVRGGTGLRQQQSDQQTTGPEKQQNSTAMNDFEILSDVSGTQEQEDLDTSDDSESDSGSDMDEDEDEENAQELISSILPLNPITLMIALQNTPSNVFDKLQPLLMNLVNTVTEPSALKNIFANLASVLNKQSHDQLNLLSTRNPNLMTALQKGAQQYISEAVMGADRAGKTIKDAINDSSKIINNIVNTIVKTGNAGAAISGGLDTANGMTNILKAARGAAISSVDDKRKAELAKLEGRRSLREINSSILGK